MLKDPLLKRYWFATGALMGIGVTANTIEDARALLDQCELFNADAIQAVVEDVDLQTLDANHIRPNMGPSNFRGVWFPFTNLV